MHLIHAVLLASALGLGVLALDDDVDVALRVRLSGLPDGVLDLDLILLVAIFAHE